MAGPLYTDVLFSGTVNPVVTLVVPPGERWVILEVLCGFAGATDLVEAVIPATGAPLFLVQSTGAGSFPAIERHTVIPAGSTWVIIASAPPSAVTVSGWRLTIV